MNKAERDYELLQRRIIYKKNDELYHFGIKGMKWGVRRYQNEDGSLTPAGKVRYDDGTSLSTKVKDTFGQAAKASKNIANKAKSTAGNLSKDENFKRKAKTAGKVGAVAAGIAVAGPLLAAGGAYLISKHMASSQSCIDGAAIVRSMLR